ncbi:MAG: CDP-diacylglycerol--inositol 3-phosphatidyltransferase, partial [Mycobacterium sp.]|nr:CDP-diacylglycerol--inositol 3-phosphatidyltransferase [Mycobacterium sp.]
LSDLPVFPLPRALPVALWLLAVANLITCAQRLHRVRHSPGAAEPMPPVGEQSDP